MYIMYMYIGLHLPPRLGVKRERFHGSRRAWQGDFPPLVGAKGRKEADRCEILGLARTLQVHRKALGSDGCRAGASVICCLYMMTILIVNRIYDITTFIYKQKVLVMVQRVRRGSVRWRQRIVDGSTDATGMKKTCN